MGQDKTSIFKDSKCINSLLIGLRIILDDPRTVRCEIDSLVRMFEKTNESDERMHHEQYSKFQSDFKSDVIALVDAFEQLGNPFLEDSGEMLDLHQSLVMPPDVVNDIRTVKDIGL